MRVSIKQRVITLGVIGVAGAIAVGTVGLSTLGKVEADVHAYAAAMDLVRAAADVDMMHDALRGDLYESIATGVPSPETDAHMAWMRNALDDATRLAADASMPDSVTAALDDADADLEVYLATIGRLTGLVATDADAARAGLADFGASYRTLETSLGAVGDVVGEHAAGLASASDAAIGRTRTFTYAAMVASLAIISVVAEATRRRLTHGVNSIRQVMNVLGDGDLRVRVETENRDELCDIGNSANTVAESFTATIRATQDNMDAVVTAAEQLTRSSTMLGQAVKETVHVADDLAASTSTISSMGQEIAAAADELAASIREISHNTEAAVRVAADAVGSTSRARADMDALAAAGSTIGDVVELISAIASQTHLLALNASIEAARAGDAGRGFSVVADEVKDLAAQTARATEDIRAKIDAIGAGTRTTRENLELVGSVIAHISEIQTSIASAVSQQASTTSEISRGISEVSRAASGIAQSAKTASESASKVAHEQQRVTEAAEGLRGVAEQGEALVGRFTL